MMPQRCSYCGKTEQQHGGKPCVGPPGSTVPLFRPGQVVQTRGAADALRLVPMGEAARLIMRHLSGDWGDMDEHDKNANNRAVRENGTLLSAYHLSTGEKIYIVTEADRSVTTLLLPEEY